jgi:glycosyltransferase involved in cell wall biosynthesis
LKAKITFSYAGNIGGLGQSYITEKTVRAYLKTECLYQLFCTAVASHLKINAQEILILRRFNEFGFAWGFLARLLKITGLTYYPSNIFYDKQVAKSLKPCDIFHGFAAQSFKSMLKAKELGAKVIADNPNTHPLNIKKILTEEYKIWKVPYLAYNSLALGRRLRALEMADRILVLSQNSQKTFTAYGCPPEKIRVVAYGVDNNLFKPKPAKDEVFRVVFMGSVCLRKGFQYLLEAWQLLKLKNAELVLAGPLTPDGVYALKKFSGKLDFKLLGALSSMEQVAHLYNQASVCVFPSVEEGFGMVVTEALASGVPVIVSENVGAKDLITDGQEGFIVPIRNARAIKEALLCLYEDKPKREQMAKNARLKVQNQTWEKYEEKLVGVYKELIGG